VSDAVKKRQKSRSSFIGSKVRSAVTPTRLKDVSRAMSENASQNQFIIIVIIITIIII